MKTVYKTSAILFFVALCWAQAVKAIETVNLHNNDNAPWKLVSLGYSYDLASDTTTFRYRVTVDGTPGLGYLNIEAPVGCELIVVFGPHQVGKDESAPDTYQDFLWFKWSQHQGNESQIYSLVLQGYVGGVTGMAAVKSGQYYAVGEATVPTCGGPDFIGFTPK